MSRGTWLVVLVSIGALAYLLFGGRSGEAPMVAGGTATAVAPPASTATGADRSATPTPSSSSIAVPPAESRGEVLSAAERRKVEQFATRFMKAFARPAGKVSYRQWWEKVAGMMTDDAVDTYAGISPSVVPFRKVTGPVTLEPIDVDSDAFWVQPVTVGTDAGVYRLLVQLESAGFADRLQVIEIQEP